MPVGSRASNEEAAMRLIGWLGLLVVAFITPATAQVDPGMLEGIKAMRGGGPPLSSCAF